MFLLNIDHIPGTNFEVLGLVQGSVVLSRDAGTDFMVGVATLVGGDLRCQGALKNESFFKMRDDPPCLGAA